MESDALAQLWEAIMDWAERTGVGPLNAHPGVMSVTLPDGYEMHLNGHNEPLKAAVNGIEVTIAPFHVWIARTGSIGGVYTSMWEGTVYGGDSIEPFIEAIRRAG